MTACADVTARATSSEGGCRVPFFSLARTFGYGRSVRTPSRFVANGGYGQDVNGPPFNPSVRFFHARFVGRQGGKAAL